MSTQREPHRVHPSEQATPNVGRRRFIEALSMAVGSLCASGCGGSGASADPLANTDPSPTAPSPSPAPSPAPPPPAPGTVLTTTSITSATTGTIPFSFGQGFVRGHVASGAGLQGLQFDVVSTWPDGSARFGIVSGVASLTAGVAQGIALGVGASAASTALSTADLKAQLAKAVVVDAGTYGSATWNGSDWDAPLRTWASGPVMSSWVYRKPIGSDVHLVAWLEVRLWSTGAVEVLPWIENGYLLVPGPTNKSATYGFTMGGTSRFSAAIDLPQHCRTPLVSGTALSHWLGIDPGVVVKHDAAYLQQTELVPSYYASVAPSDNSVAKQPSTYTPLQQGSYSVAMGQAGYQPSIGMLPEWDVLYLTSTATSLWSAIQRQSYSAGRYGIHYRDETTNLPARLIDYPHLSLAYNGGAIGDCGTSTTGTYTPTPTGTVPPIWDTQHHPSIGYMAALVTGRFYHVEETQFVAALNSLKDSDSAPYGRNGDLGIIKTESAAFSCRGAAWALRSLVQAVIVSPSGATKTELARILDNNIDYYYGRYAAPGAKSSPQGFPAPYSDYTPFGTGTTTSGSTSTVVTFNTVDNIYRGNAAYDDYCVGQWLQIGGQSRQITHYDAVPGTCTVSPAFTVNSASTAFELGDKVWLFATWMQDFFCAAWGYIKALQTGTTHGANLDSFYAWNVQSVIGRLGLTGSSEYLYRDAVPYTIPIAPSDHADWDGGTGPWYSNWGDIWAAAQAHSASTPTSDKALGDGSLRCDLRSGDDPSDPTGYWGNLQPALAYAVRHNVAGAAAGYSRMTGAPNWSTLKANFNSAPVWAVRPPN